MLTVTVTYTDYAVAKKAKVFDIKVPDLDHAHDACKAVFEHASKPTVALLDVCVYGTDGGSLLYEWTPKGGWRALQSVA